VQKNGRQKVSPLAASTHGALVGLEFTVKEGGIVLKLCNDLNVSVKGRLTLWELNKDTIVREQ